MSETSSGAWNAAVAGGVAASPSQGAGDQRQPLDSPAPGVGLRDAPWLLRGFAADKTPCFFYRRKWILFFFPHCLLKMQLVIHSVLESWSWEKTTELP